MAYRIDNSTASAVLPDPKPVGPTVGGYFTRGNPSTATPATIVDDDFLNSLQEEVCQTIEAAGITLLKNDYTQLKKAIDYLHQKNGAVYASSSSSPNIYTATLSPAPVAYTEGMGLLVKFTNANTNSATINLNTLGAKSIKRTDGTALQAGDITAGMVANLVYDGTNFQLLNLTITPNVYTTSSSINTYVASLVAPPVSYFAGMHASVKFTNANTSAATINFNSLGAASIKRPDGTALQAGDIASGMIAYLIYDGTNFQLLNPNKVIRRINTIYISSSSTYVPSLGLVHADVELVGAGGGGAGATSTVGHVGAGSGGGGGGYAMKRCYPSDIGASQSVTIGTLGAAGGPGSAGSAGGTTSFGSIFGVTGGGGGLTSNNAATDSFGGGANGGTPTGSPDFSIAGEVGDGAAVLVSGGTAKAGRGGDSVWGRGGVGGLQTLGGTAGSGWGAGGGGGATVGSASATGAVGVQGYAKITEYLSI